MRVDRLVIRYMDRTLMKGSSSDFSPEKRFFHLNLISGGVVKVDSNNMKAAFFVKTFKGDESYKYRYKDYIPWGGKKIKVKFNDGEVMVGFVPSHHNGDEGFFVTPADLKGNNERVFVMASATEAIDYF